MRRKPILNPHFIGFAHYGKKPPIILDDDTVFFPCSEHILQLSVNDVNYFLRESSLKISEICKKYDHLLKNCEYAELFYDTPYHDVTYEYNKEDKKWYLVDQGIGYSR